MKRIFISSTFKDMQYERDVLREVAAKLDAEAFKRGDGVSLCDLRSGVNTLDLDSEAGAAKVLEVCLDEIDRCRPYMIVLLGNRYGWVRQRHEKRERRDERGLMFYAVLLGNMIFGNRTRAKGGARERWTCNKQKMHPPISRVESGLAGGGGKG